VRVYGRPDVDRPRRPAPQLSLLGISRTLLLGLSGICPVCRRGRIFRTYYTPHERCPSCGVEFERNRGELTGGMGINLVICQFLALALALYVTFVTNYPIALELAASVVITLAFGLLFHRPARGAWIAVLYLTGAIYEA
jgi:uncharacterized protein (DUF983 family)